MDRQIYPNRGLAVPKITESHHIPNFIVQVCIGIHIHEYASQNEGT